MIINNKGWNLDSSYSLLPSSFYTFTNPTPVPSPELVVFNRSLASSLGLNIDACESLDGVKIFAGNRIPEGSQPLAQAYAGHQFGYFTMLGDGRAILLGEQITPEMKRYDIQLKGSGRTPYSRRGDGRAALGPMLREYIISEAMVALGIPTTRSLAVVTTGDVVARETMKTGAILTRVASSHIRVGTFEYAAHFTSVENLRALADYTLDRHYPDYEGVSNKYLYLLQEVIKRQALLIAKWQLVGFIHGVMNTDNMTLSGETIDYGPCAFMDRYDPKTVFSSIDTYGRYAYVNQPFIAEWNLSRLAEALLPLINENRDEAINQAEEVLAQFEDLYQDNWLTGMRAKLGLFNEEKQDETLIKELLSIMEKHHVDYTNTFRALSLNQLDDTKLLDYQEFNDWYALWKERLSRQNRSSESVYELMRKNNPAIIPRNHRVEEALEAAVNGDFTVMHQLLDVLSKPYAYSTNQEAFTTLPAPSTCRYRTFCGT